MAYVQSEPRRAHRVTVWDRIEYRFIVGVIFTFCLATAPVKRLFHAVMPDAFPPKETKQSVFAEAKSIAHTAAGYAFKH